MNAEEIINNHLREDTPKVLNIFIKSYITGILSNDKLVDIEFFGSTIKIPVTTDRLLNMVSKSSTGENGKKDEIIASFFASAFALNMTTIIENIILESKMNKPTIQ